MKNVINLAPLFEGHYKSNISLEVKKFIGGKMESFIAWVGGKRLLRKEIVNRFPQDGVKKYVEVFGGAGWVLFYKDKHAEKEVYNDVNSELVNLFRNVKSSRSSGKRA